MKIPIIECPKCHAKLKVQISDEDILKFMADLYERKMETTT